MRATKKRGSSRAFWVETLPAGQQTSQARAIRPFVKKEEVRGVITDMPFSPLLVM
jgi:hypothetical protein